MKRVMSALAMVLAATVAHAQPLAPPSGTAAPPPGTQLDDRGYYEVGYQAMLRGDYNAARAAFATAASMSSDPTLQRTASEMARLAGDMGARSSMIQTMPAPGAARLVNEDDEDSGGRATFVTTTTIAAFYSGIVLDDLIDVDSIQSGTLVVMGTTAAGVLGSVFGTSGRRMTGGMADAWSLGMFTGAANALLLAGPFGLYDASESSSEKVQGLVLGAAWGGAAAGLLIADGVDPTRAQVSVAGTIEYMAVTSTLLGFAVAQPSNLDGNTFLTITAVGLDVGLAAGTAFASKLDWSLSRARYVGLGSFLGGLAGAGTSLLFATNDPSDGKLRAAAGITLAGLWGGFAIATHLTSDMAPDLRFRTRAPQEGLRMMVGPAAIPHGAGLGVSGAF